MAAAEKRMPKLVARFMALKGYLLTTCVKESVYLAKASCEYYELACIRSGVEFTSDDKRRLGHQLLDCKPTRNWYPDPKRIFGGVEVTVDELVAEAQARRSVVQ